MAACLSLQFPLIFKALCLLAFYSFLRLSNILPQPAASFDSTRHLSVGDILFSHNAAIVIVKWAKALQGRVNIASISITVLGFSYLCPVVVLSAMLGHRHKNYPLFQISTRRGCIPLTDSVARKHLKKVSTIQNVPKYLTFHDCRTGGAT